ARSRPRRVARFTGETMFPPWAPFFAPRTDKCCCIRERVLGCSEWRITLDGEGGIRTLEARIHAPNALAGRRLQPLGHFSGVARQVSAPDFRLRREIPLSREVQRASFVDHPDAGFLPLPAPSQARCGPPRRAF